ncbi:uncharacterized protein (DUF305 family) [Agromyces flavus]|uniref:Uncharacterized conserved protein, DUF305 family n=1 Tax=Agromyces flavus TaxID=589382 RepID=A0A1H1YS97_9MICO|nr:DUF305 domain-containing protein [Agromyces flavus]MCP2366792.1 uncharacterized protein (DUF305 family) [Agromyces flavus]GGI45379.1 hypothetical protein GCM10010932_09340 [Agromyces flavus]SDT24253.1 Uncharacterized conserved protein, DUF305 family [Agromyces flavus]
MTAVERPLVLATAVALALGLSACTASGSGAPEPTSPTVQLGAPGEPNRTLSPDEAAAVEGPEHTDDDVAFMQMMVVHHDQAITMTGWVDDRTQDRDIRLLAERMRLSQEAEIEFIAGWLQDRGAPLRGDHADHAGGAMPGMLAEDQLERLEASSGEEFERLFLEYMIQHHAGALEMVADLWSAGGGQEVEIGRFARDVEGDQGIEITRMQAMLAEHSS